MVGEEEDEQYPDDERQAEEAAGADGLPVAVADHRRGTAGGQADEAAIDAHGGDCGDEGGQEKAGSEDAVYGAKQGTGGDGEEQGERKAGAEGKGLGADHAGDGDDGADGEINFAEKDDPGHAEGGDGDDGDLLEDVHEVRQRQEAAVAEGEDGAEDDEGDDDAAVLAHQAVQGGVKGWG